MEGRVTASVSQLGVVLSERRRSVGWTQRELADAAGVSIGVVRDLEQGVSQRPRPDSLQRLAAALEVPAQGLQAATEPGLRAGAAVTVTAVEQPVMLQVLGPLLTWRRGQRLRLAGAKQRAVLGLLALHPDTVVSRAAIAEVLWGDVAPATGAAMIQSHLSRLRTLLDPSRSLIGRSGLLEVAGSGYRLRTDQAGLDLLAYRWLAERAREALRVADTAAACDLFEQAVQLWRGEPVADVALLSEHPSVTGLVQQHADLLVEYAETACGLGWHDRVLPLLQSLAGRHPLDERVHACLMIALAGSGRQAAALELFEQVRRQLDERLGVRPGEALAAAHMQVLRHELPSAASIVGAAVSSPVQLPLAIADFTGRSAQLAQLPELLCPAGSERGLPVVVISGPPGVGKTALMVQAGHALRDTFPDGQLWVQLDGASDRPRDPGDVLGEFLRALGVHGSAIPEAAHERAALYRSRLAGRRLLVAVDDAASAAQVLPLLPGTVGCAVLVTSRRQLIELPGARLIPLGPLSPAEAAELLGQVAGAWRIGAEPDAAAELAAGCGQLPLALRIAGAKLAARGIASVAALAKAVADEQNRLDALQIGDLSVRASLASGYQSLSTPARRAFRLLALLGPCDVAEWTVATLLGETDAGRMVNELCDRSMLAVVGSDATGQPRYRLHDLLRDYAAEELAQEPETHRATALRRARDGWLQLATAASARLTPDPYFATGEDESGPAAILPAALVAGLTADPLAWFAAERLNLLAAADSGCREGQYRSAAQLATTLAGYHHIQDRHQDAEAIWTHVAAAAGRAGDVAAKANAQLRIGAALVQCCRARSAVSILDECIRVFERSGNADALAAALYWRAESAWELDAFDEGRRYAQRGVAVAQQTGNTHAEWLNLRSLTNSLGTLGRRAGTLEAGERALALAAQFAGDTYLAVSLHTVAVACNWVGEWDRAVALSRQTLRLSRSLGDARLEALTLGVFGDAYNGLGRHQDAVHVLSLALPKFTELANERFEALCLLKRGHAYQALGQVSEARQDVARCLPVFRRRGMPRHEQRALRVLDGCRPTAPGTSLQGPSAHCDRAGSNR